MRMKQIKRRTAKCVLCLKADAAIWGGWVLRGTREPILSGMCRKCHKTRGLGFVGRYDKRMGTKDINS